MNDTTTLEMTDAASDTTRGPVVITVNPTLGSAVTIATSLPLPDASVTTYPSAQYWQELQAVGGVAPYTWSVTSGALPDGLSLDSSTGVISGLAGTLPDPASPDNLLPGELGDSTFAITVTDSSTPTLSETRDVSPRDAAEHAREPGRPVDVPAALPQLRNA